MVHQIISSQKASGPTTEELVKTGLEFYRANPALGFEPAARHGMNEHGLYADSKKNAPGYETRMLVMKKIRETIENEGQGTSTKTLKKSKGYRTKYERDAYYHSLRTAHID